MFCDELALAPAAGIKPREALQKRSGDSSPCGGGLDDGGGGSDGGQMNPCFSTQTCGSDPACYGAGGGCLGCTIDAGCVVFDQIGYCISGCGNYQPPTIPDPSSCAVYGIPAIDAIIGSDYKLRSLIILLANFHLRPRIVLGSLPAHIAATTDIDGTITWDGAQVAGARQPANQILFHEAVHSFYRTLEPINYLSTSTQISFPGGSEGLTAPVDGATTTLTYSFVADYGEESYEHVLVHNAIRDTYGNDLSGAILGSYGIVVDLAGNILVAPSVEVDVAASTLPSMRITQLANVDAMAEAQRGTHLPQTFGPSHGLSTLLATAGLYCWAQYGKSSYIPGPAWNGDVYL